MSRKQERDGGMPGKGNNLIEPTAGNKVVLAVMRWVTCNVPMSIY